jgi:uncharacterized protein (DUF1330 family)
VSAIFEASVPIPFDSFQYGHMPIFGEGAYHNGMIVRFPDRDTALARYNSPAYQALLDIRNAALDCRFRLVG